MPHAGPFGVRITRDNVAWRTSRLMSRISVLLVPRGEDREDPVCVLFTMAVIR
jgi:hypothetical protein